MMGLYNVGQGAVHGCVYPCDDPGRRRPADEEEPRQRRRPAGDHPFARLRRPAVHPGVDGHRDAGRADARREGPGDRPQHVAAVRHGPQFLQQALERGAVRPDEPGGRRRGQVRPARCTWRTAGSSRAWSTRASPWRTNSKGSISRPPSRPLHFLLGRAVRLVPGGREAAPGRPRRTVGRRSGCWPSCWTGRCGSCTRSSRS